jgi:hypothetical protein
MLVISAFLKAEMAVPLTLAIVERIDPHVEARRTQLQPSEAHFADQN